MLIMSYDNGPLLTEMTILPLLTPKDGSTWWSINIRGGVHQAPLYCKLIPMELLPLMAVTAELVGEDGRL